MTEREFDMLRSGDLLWRDGSPTVLRVMTVKKDQHNRVQFLLCQQGTGLQPVQIARASAHDLRVD